VSTRGGSRARVTTVTAESILTSIQLAGRPVKIGEMYTLLDVDTKQERKGIANRLPTLVRDGKLRVIKNGGTNLYEAVEKMRPGLLAEAKSSVALDGETYSIPPMPKETLPAVRQTNGHRPALSVEDACVGMLLGMTGKESVPIRRLPEIAAWMRDTGDLLESLR
jgi:hypothetical protein